MIQNKQPVCPDCVESDAAAPDRRSFLRTLTSTAAAIGSSTLWAVPRAAAAPSPNSAAETAVKAFYETLTAAQKKDICFDWDYQHPERGLLALDGALAKDGALLSGEERAELDAARLRLQTAAKGEDRDAITAAAEALETLSKPFAERRMDRGIREALSGLSVADLEGRVGRD